jgi:hypothetical protein
MKKVEQAAVNSKQVVISKVNLLRNGIKMFRKGSPYHVHETDGDHIQLVNRHGIFSDFIPKESVEIVTGNQ